MSTTQPIKTMEDIEEMKQYFYRNGEMRNYALVTMGISPAIIMSIYNHSSMEVTIRYLAIDQDDKDEVYKNIIL